MNEDLGIEYFDDVVAKRDEATQESSSLMKTPFRLSARVGETLLGIPGDLRETFTAIATGIPEYFAGEELPRYREAVESIPSALSKTPGIMGTGAALLAQAPTSQEIREGVTQRFTGDYLEPQTEMQALGDEIASDFASLLLPVKGKIPFARALGSSLIANAGSEVVKQFGGQEGKDYSKLGLLFATGLVGNRQGGAKQYIRNLYNEMEKAVPAEAQISAKPLLNKLGNIEKALKKGDPKDPSKQIVFQKINAVNDKVRKGNIRVDELIELNKSTNEAIFDSRDLSRGANKLYEVRDSIHQAIKEYGSSNPEFLGKWKDANEAYAATKMSRKVSDFITKNIKPKDYAYAASALGLGGLAAGKGAALSTLGGAAGIGAAAYSAEIMKRITQSPALRKYYSNVVSGALKGNAASMSRAMNQLNKGLESSFDADEYETIEFNN